MSAFFGDPIAGPLFALEIPHRRGLEYYEAIIPAMVAGIYSFAVFRLQVRRHLQFWTLWNLASTQLLKPD